MLEIKFVRENPDIIKKDLIKRRDTEKLKWLDDLLDSDKKYRALLQEVEKLRHKRNTIAQEINQLKKKRKDISQKIDEARELPAIIKRKEELLLKLRKKINFYLMRLPNILHKSVPIGKDENDNKQIRKHGTIPKPKFKLKSHGELIQSSNLGDFETASKVSGKGFNYLFNGLALMDLALQRFAIDFLLKKKYKLIQVPLMLRRKPYEGVTDLADFETMMYKVENEDLYLIATSEHSIASLMIGKTLNKLPLKFVAVSPCFRREIGSHGVDERGLFRVHQFNKVEQFIFCKPDQSWKLHEELIKNAEELNKKLKLPYRIMNVCTGDIGTVASKKYDLEVYMPREKKYKEVASCSNCTSYQAVRLGIKYKKSDKKEYVHTLNSTAIATGRTIRAILENYQQKDSSIKVPNVLQPYMNRIKVIGKNG